MSDTPSTGAASQAAAAQNTLADAARREGDSVRDQAARAGETLRQEGASLGDGVRRRASETAEEGKAAAASSLSDFTAAIRKASEELGQRDQSMAAGLARQAAAGLEQAADAINGHSVPEITRSVADFARRQPGAFLIGAALAGVALGRFARASGDHAGPLGSGRDRFDDARHAEDRTGDTRHEAPTGRTGIGGRTASTVSSASPGLDASGERHGTVASTFSGTAGAGSANPAATSSQADATGLAGSASAGSSLNRPGTSGSTDTAGLSGASSSSTGERP